ncbi:Putative uncharacterized protein [Lactobacillus acidophilus DSM 20079 = JCM 1132 = NBRC 13951 = CIP 76.13]|nr:Putative uncharacterized protein [Lactobacillus acidophilus DSM 20079 = JCM 1132 = NBRC 13951 = CIP 76.13]CDF69815.1 Putative uncharacterized protein [Lactobacillus acidophilus CIRM-BIA 442]CDF71612.1 Putative uncharacterized protein [Lactobacillus acidophilus CIRM-BIA 445]CDF75432.1 Putative uncharacterized protein [Lactobacillus acidophilus DSM 20242]
MIEGEGHLFTGKNRPKVLKLVGDFLTK